MFAVSCKHQCNRILAIASLTEELEAYHAHHEHTNLVSRSHCSDPVCIEGEMAIRWLLQRTTLPAQQEQNTTA